MKTNTNIMMQNKNIISIVLGTALILLVPLAAMQFTDEVNWGLGDFAVIGALMLGAGLIFELAARMVRNIKHKAAIGAAVGVALLLVWIELAVGVFGTPVAGS